MHPDLFQIGPLTVRAYGTMIVLGFFLGISLVRLRSKKYMMKWDDCLDLSFYLLLAGIVGGKLFYWLILPANFNSEMELLFSNPMRFLQNLGSGFEFFGSLFVGILTFILFVRRRRMPLLKTLDLFAPAMPLVHAGGRIGCFLAGCCFGKECNHWWAVTFNDPNTLAPPGIPLHPTQLYESICLLILVGILLVIEKWVSKIEGRMISLYVIGYTVIRFIVEYFRADARGSAMGGTLSMTQVLAIFAAVIAVTVYIFLTLKKYRETRNSPS